MRHHIVPRCKVLREQRQARRWSRIEREWAARNLAVLVETHPLTIVGCWADRLASFFRR